MNSISHSHLLESTDNTNPITSVKPTNIVPQKIQNFQQLASFPLKFKKTDHEPNLKF